MSLVVLNGFALVLAVLDIVGNYLAGVHHAIGWAILAAYKGLWVGFALVTGAYLLIPASIVLGVVMARNYLSRKQEPAGGVDMRYKVCVDPQRNTGYRWKVYRWSEPSWVLIHSGWSPDYDTAWQAANRIAQPSARSL